MKLTEKSLAAINTASVCALLFIWVLPDTIALRHLLLGIGCLSGLVLIRDNRTFFIPFRTALIPLILLCSLFIWVGIHYLFFSLNPALELSEIRGLWFRAFAGVIMALGLAISIQKYSYFSKYFIFSLFFVPLINLSAYIYAGFQNGGLVRPNDFVRFLFIKIETTYFGAIASSAAIANLIYFLVLRKDDKNYKLITFNFLGLVVVLLSALVVGTKNGVAIAVSLCVLLVLIMAIGILKNLHRVNRVSLLLCLLVILAVGGVWKSHKTTAYEGWDTIFSDVKVGVQIDKYHQWQEGEHEFIAPINEKGIPVVGNSYFRTAWATVGVRLISEYPLGYGSINRSFVGLLDEANINHVHQGQVHSGWIDFGLAYGLPGLLIIFATMLVIIFMGIAQPYLQNIYAVMICIALIPMGIIAEITYKQYFEATIFFLAFAASNILCSKTQSFKK
jgi:hypothetical protein